MNSVLVAASIQMAIALCHPAKVESVATPPKKAPEVVWQMSDCQDGRCVRPVTPLQVRPR